MKGNINLISYDCYQQATEKQLAGLKWKENRVYYISEIHNEKMQDEIYGYIDDRCRRLSLSTVVNDIYRFDLLKEFLNEKCTSCSSITDKKWEELERSYKAFLYKKGLALYVRRNRPDRRNVEQQSSAQVSFLKMYYEYVVKCKTADIPENREEQLVKQMMEKEGITEELKRQDNMEWTRRMNTLCHDAEEMILTEMIYTKG